MITSAPNPPWKWIRKSDKKEYEHNTNTVWGAVGVGEVVTHRSWISIKLIIEWARQNKGADGKVCVFFPDYYCYDTIFQLKDMIDIVYYPIMPDLRPDVKACRELCREKRPDIIICCHYFGIIQSFNDMSVLAKQQNAILVEDAVHVLYSDKVGRSSDFIIFSPWKLLGLPDGAVLVVGKKSKYADNVKSVTAWFEDRQESLESFRVCKWKCKKAIQKILPTFRPGSEAAIDISTAGEPARERVYTVSRFSRGLLHEISRETVLEIGERRKENLYYLAEFCQRSYGMRLKYVYEGDIPYAAIFDLKNMDTRTICTELGKLGRIVSKWPTLSQGLPEGSRAADMLADMLMISVHQGLNINYIARHMERKRKLKKNDDISFVTLDENEYMDLLQRTDRFTPLLQSNVWGEVKQEVQGWNPRYNAIRLNGETVGCFLVLTKKRIVTVNRINQGICWLSDPDRVQRYRIYGELKAKYTKRGQILFLSPREPRTGEVLSEMLGNGFRYRNAFWASGLIDLAEDIDIMRSNLDSKWRNQLKKAEKGPITVAVETAEDELEVLLKMHIRHKSEKGYDDSGDDITRALLRKKAVIAIIARLNIEIVGFVMLARHDNNATYYIGWSSEMGYQHNVNKLLLWTAVLKLKEIGVRWLDLGGIDNVHTKNIADFKLGMGCEYFETAGEFAGW